TELIEVVYNRRVDRSSFNYSRFMMHLKYFSSRVLCNEKIKQKNIGDIYEQFLEKDFQLQRAIHEIERYLYATFKYDSLLEEKLYLSIRIKVLMD
ncbi:transcriptional antiterminator, partial [Escherichia coli]|nr:transcriptional antiterminator [Escherichia coli]EER2204084.1 transcriptional antiterminator [Escherichia coli]EER8103201.1 transcriptional antiterminator [Escherichia coli]EES1590272.1 transcriptional antiterminator [Escherichia coli]EEV4410122.1 transcriptional antiterminator [Escherichia coli]